MEATKIRSSLIYKYFNAKEETKSLEKNTLSLQILKIDEMINLGSEPYNNENLDF